jgi:capsid protein
MAKLFDLFKRSAPKPARIPRSGANVDSTPRSKAGYFEALERGNNRAPLPLYALSMAGQRISAASRRELSLIGRYLYDNNSLASYAVDQIALYSVPVTPLAASSDPDWNRLADEWFSTWCYRADYSGRFHFATLQRLASIALDVDGDLGFNLVNEDGIPQLQLVSSHSIASDEKKPSQDTHDGVQIDKAGRVIGYYVRSGTGHTRVEPASFFHIFEPDRFESYRGYSPMRRGMNDIRDFKEIKGFQKIAQKFRGGLIASIKTKDGMLNQNEWGDDTGRPKSATDSEFEKGVGVADLIEGQIPVLPEGQELQLEQGNLDSSSSLEFMDALAAHFVCSLGFPPAFFLDQKLNGPNQRAVIGKAQRRFDSRQSTMKNFHRWLWPRLIGHAIASGELPSVKGWDRCTFQAPPRFTIDVGREASQERDDVSNGLMTRQNHYANRGRDWRNDTDQLINEDDYIITRAKELAARHGVPVEVILARYGYENKSAPPQAAVGPDGKPLPPKKHQQEEDEENDDSTD